MLHVPHLPGSSELSEESRGRLLDSALRLVEDRSRSASAVYLAVCGVLWVASSLPDENRGLLVGVTVAFGVLVPLRALIARFVKRRGLPPTRRRYLLFVLPYYASGLTWSVFSGLVSFAYGDAWISLFLHMLIGFGGLTAVMLYAPLPRTSLGYAALLMLPSLALALASGMKTGPFLALLVAVFFLLNVPFTLRLGRDYWSGVISSALLELRAAQLHEAKEAAEGASRAKTGLLAAVSHELRTPMNGVLGMADLLLNTPLSPEQRDYAETVRGSASALVGLLDDLLDLARLESMPVVLSLRPFSPRRLAREVTDLFTPEARKKGVALLMSASEAVPHRAIGDAGRLRQVVVNLLSNALKFTDEGTVKVELDVEPAAEGAIALVVSVTDTGIGISPDTREHIFEPFRQADATIRPRFGGTGLGLTICKDLVHALAGRIELVSQAARGSTFRVVIPLQGAPHAAPSDPALSLPSLSPLYERVLLAEDDVVSQRVTRLLLERMGCSVDVAETGVEALARLAERSYDVVLMDCQMPEMDGYEATLRLRERGDAVVVLAVTANTERASLDRCGEVGMDGVIAKPVTERALHKALVTARRDVVSETA